MNPAQELHRAGQSLWLDSINRKLLTSGTLARYVRELAVTGLTSNPTILGHAMAASTEYDGSLRRHLAAGVRGAQDLVYAVALEDLREAADLFLPVWEETRGVDGYVSLEVPPGLAYDADQSVEVARRLHRQADRPNLLVKIPGTPPGLAAMERLVADGIGINVTLLFSDTHYLQTADAYLRALETRAAAGSPLDVPSVASIFVSRWDRAADPLLPESLHGRLGLAMTQKVYASHRALIEDERWRRLAQAGARPQRVLWASTSTKDPSFPDTYYLGRLAAPETIDTVPEKALLAFADHGGPIELMRPDYGAAEQGIAEAAAQGIDVDALGESLQRQGARAFEADWATLLDAIAAKADRLAGAARRDPSTPRAGRSGNVQADPWDEVVEGSFPASDPPPGPGILGGPHRPPG
ncbi:MAG: transaldolase [Candidatus Dormibacteraceae bacterium]